MRAESYMFVRAITTMIEDLVIWRRHLPVSCDASDGLHSSSSHVRNMNSIRRGAATEVLWTN